MNVELISALAGDRELTDDERIRLDTQRRERGEAFYSDLLYAITHLYFAPEIAESLWKNILEHKDDLEGALGRNVRITVATLDYLSNITNDMLAPTLISESYAAEIADLAMRDGLTDLYNHSTCYELLELEFRTHRRYGIGFSLLLLDIDDFKKVNDQHGHPEGDRVLVALAKVLKNQVRDSDICCRMGGEEFAVILPFTNKPEEAFEIAERVREQIAQVTCQGGQSISASIGVAIYDGGLHSPIALVEKADQALYQAKALGKNRVVVSGVTP